MNTLIISILLYPYAYQMEAMAFSLIFLLFFGALAYSIYRLIIWKMNTKMIAVFNRLLKIVTVSLVVLFFAEVIVSLITIYQVNIQLGFSYATPNTPEGELFEIQKVVTGKTMDKAGLKLFDQVQMRSVNNLYKLIINNQGNEVVIPIKRDKKKLEIKVKVPKLDLPLARVSFWF